MKLEMNKPRALLFMLLFCALTCFMPGVAAQSSGVVLRYKDVVGTYKDRLTGSIFTVARAPGGMIRVEFHGVYPYRLADGTRSANFGTAEVTTKLAFDTATFTPNYAREFTPPAPCTIRLVFKPRRIIATQKGSPGECGFGNNVSAEGTYRLTSRRVQRFNEQGSPVN